MFQTMQLPSKLVSSFKHVVETNRKSGFIWIHDLIMNMWVKSQESEALGIYYKIRRVK